jgi:hypothetical protein
VHHSFDLTACRGVHAASFPHDEVRPNATWGVAFVHRAPEDAHMPTLLFSLRQVPDDEADEVRALMREHAIEFYETPASKWGLGAGALWTRDADAATRAKALIADYQNTRAERARNERATSVRDGTARTFLDVVREEPLRVFLVLLGVAFFIAICALPWFALTR